jgi:hypothetical protein
MRSLWKQGQHREGHLGLYVGLDGERKKERLLSSLATWIRETGNRFDVSVD